MSTKSQFAPLMNTGFGCWRYTVQPEESMTAFVRRDEIGMHMIESGRIRMIWAKGRRFELGTDQLMVTWGGTPLRAEWLCRDTVLYGLHIPLAVFLSWRLMPAFKAALLAREAVLERDSSESLRDRLMMAAWCRLYENQNEHTRQIILLEAEARLRRMALTYRSSEEQLAPERSTTIDRAIRMVASRLGHPFSVAGLAKELGVHPNYLSTIFHRETGQLLSGYLIRYRLAHACALLTSTNDKIIDIANATGFGSVPQFHSMFRRHYRCTPRQYRLKN